MLAPERDHQRQVTFEASTEHGRMLIGDTLAAFPISARLDGRPPTASLFQLGPLGRHGVPEAPRRHLRRRKRRVSGSAPWTWTSPPGMSRKPGPEAAAVIGPLLGNPAAASEASNALHPKSFIRHAGALRVRATRWPGRPSAPS